MISNTFIELIDFVAEHPNSRVGGRVVTEIVSALNR
jgi:hypothetical protein